MSLTDSTDIYPIILMLKILDIFFSYPVLVFKVLRLSRTPGQATPGKKTCHNNEAGFLAGWLLCISPNSEVTASETPPFPHLGCVPAVVPCFQRTTCLCFPTICQGHHGTVKLVNHLTQLGSAIWHLSLYHHHHHHNHHHHQQGCAEQIF